MFSKNLIGCFSFRGIFIAIQGNKLGKNSIFNPSNFHTHVLLLPCQNSRRKKIGAQLLPSPMYINMDSNGNCKNKMKQKKSTERIGRITVNIELNSTPVFIISISINFATFFSLSSFICLFLYVFCYCCCGPGFYSPKADEACDPVACI